jgi:hypothetical protein
VDESTKRVRRDDSQEPQDEQDHKNCPEHIDPCSFVQIDAEANQAEAGVPVCEAARLFPRTGR